jgi:tRNA A-37 threonylcarbamoyl transferase component Bud32
VVCKKGRRATRNEAAALKLVKMQSDIPVPQLLSATFFIKDGAENGTLLMEKVEGSCLDDVWDGFDDSTKSRICEDIWGIVDKLQQIQHTSELSYLYQCAADGSTSNDILTRDLQSPKRPILSDEALRFRIYERYLHFNGGSFEGDLLPELPQSNTSVFIYGDLTPRNIIVHERRITGVIDWEDSG